MPLLLRLAFWCASAGVLTLSLISAPDMLPSTGWDKTNHVLGFSALSFLGYLAYPKRLFMLVVGLVLFGIAIEGLQSLRPNRYAELNDVVADVIGVALGLLLAHLVQRHFR